MKKILLTIALVIPILTIGQTVTENYVKSTAYQVPTLDGNVSNSDKQESITYYDGLGRPKQTIAVRAGGQGENIVSYIPYDAFGRTPKQYLPYATSTETPNPLEMMDQVSLKTSIENFYDTPKYENTENPYSEMVYDSSPLNRVIEQGAPGNSWQVDTDHTIKYKYQTNTPYDVLNFEVDFQGGNLESPILKLSGTFLSNQLYVRIVKDENWKPSSGNIHTTREFTNKQGQVVLKRTYDSNSHHDTYYVYDDFGNLTYVLSPEASSSITYGFPQQLVTNAKDILNDLGYQYKYDYRNRLIEKKIPGKGWEYIVYNLLDQPVLTQDASLRESGQWLLTKYDAFGRVAFTGIVSSGQGRTWQQNTANDTQNYPTVYETQLTTTHSTVAGTQMYYTNNSFPVGSVSRILTINYYDDYVDLGGYTIPSSVYGQNITTQTKSLPTVSKVRVLGTDDWITSVTGYDNKGRAIFGFSENTYLDTEDIAESQLDFTGNVLESTTTHHKENHPGVVTIDYFTYDHQNRLLSHKQKINNEPLQLIASNFYDELGQLISKDVGGETTFDGYTDLVKVTIDSDGNVNRTGSSNSDNGWDARLKTKGEIKEDGGIQFTTVHDAHRYYRVGLVNADTNNEEDHYYDYGIYIRADNTNNDGLSDVNILVGSVTPNSYVGSYQAGDTFKIERKNGNILFKKNNVVFHTEALDHPDATFVGKASLYSYNSQIANLSIFGDFIDKKLQKVDYAYNVRGWLTDINNVNNNSFGRGPLFSLHINYDNPVEGDAGLAGRAVPLYNGNISQTIWKTESDDKERRTYGYKYDALNRISTAYSRKGLNLTEYDHFNVSEIEYDKNGNIQTLTRQGENNNGSPLNMDDLVYTYNGNQLQRVADNGHPNLKNEGFYDGNTSGNDYDYDVNGNMIEDKNKGISAIAYNHLNLPIIVTIAGTDSQNQTQQGTIRYVYDATGIKLAKVVHDNTQQSTISTFYSGGYIYENNNGNEQLKMFPHPEGYVEPVYNTTKSISKFSIQTQSTSSSNYQYVYQYKDHLGNVRLTYADSDGNGSINPSSEIISEKNYYPFGLQHKGYNNVVNGTEHPYKYNGKEHNQELGLDVYDFGWRNYDPAVGRWFNVDPLAEDYYSYSTYNFTLNNPVFFIDPDGRGVTDWYKNADGGLVYDSSITSQEGLDNAGIAGEYIGSSFLGEDQNGQVFEFGSDGNIGYVPGAGKSAYTATGVFSNSDFVGITSKELGRKSDKSMASAGALVLNPTNANPLKGIVSGLAGLAMLTTAAIQVSGTNDMTYELTSEPPSFNYVTYTKTNSAGQVYVGRSSGYGDPASIVARRDSGHHMTGFGTATLSTYAPATVPGGYATRAVDPSYWSIRGSEQVQIEGYRAAGISANRINGIGPNNPNIQKYIEAAKNVLRH